MNYRFAAASDAAILAGMNHQLIRDEGHRNPMTVAELEDRMRGWLEGEYRAVIFEQDVQPTGYALFRNEAEFVYLRQFFVCRAFRRQGVGRAAMHWLLVNVWNGIERVRLEVLVANSAGIAFWRALGFRDYALTMERE
ncbi:MAG: N-acetyltransferase family protein [Deltaproteobacteria bacterium]